MSGARFIRIDGKPYRYVATVDEGRTFYFSAGRSIAVEKFDMRPGGTEFDFQVNSRAVRNGRPEQIAAMQSRLDREFDELRVKSNLFGLPVSYGNINEMRRQRRIELSYGEMRPQIFASHVAGSPVAWRIWFKRAYYSGNPSAPGLSKTTASARADGSASIGAMSGHSSNGQASGGIGPLTNAAGMLRVYVHGDDKFQVFGQPFDRGDMIFPSDHVGRASKQFCSGPRLVRRVPILALLLVTSCEGGTGGPPDQGPHAYLLLRPATEQKGWAAIDAMRERLPADQRRRIRTAGLVSTEDPLMYVDFDGTCATDFVAAARSIAERAGTPAMSCSATLPGAL